MIIRSTVSISPFVLVDYAAFRCPPKAATPKVALAFDAGADPACTRRGPAWVIGCAARTSRTKIIKRQRLTAWVANESAGWSFLHVLPR